MAKSAYSFNDMPVLKHSRSRFDLSHDVKTSGNVGTLYPFEVQEVYPGDTFKVKTNVVARLSSQFIRPVMDNLFLDVYYFFVPSRLLYDKFVNVFGENTESAWANTQEYECPSLRSGGAVASKSVAEYLSLPVGYSPTGNDNVTLLPFRAFAKVYDEWFRDQNNVNPMHVQKGETATSEQLNSNAWAPNNYTGMLPRVGKLKDYFVTALPAPQKGDPVELGVVGNIPVRTLGNEIPNVIDNDMLGLRLRGEQGQVLTGGMSLAINDLGYLTTYGDNRDNSTGDIGDINLTPTNLWAIGSDAQAINVNELRYAFALQKMLERDSVFGSRYTEMLQAHWGVFAGDYRLQRSEYLGGRRVPISIQQVTQSTGFASDKANNELGNVGAFSLTNGKSRFTKSFVEHGFVIGVFCIRQFHTYQQGIERFWRRRKREQFFDPVFSNIGYQPIYKSELMAGVDPETPFGYGEAWADLRYRPNRVSGQMRSGVDNSLDVWHFADYYANAPTLNSQFIEETPTYVNRTITVDSNEQDQFILDFYIENIAYRCLPTYSFPSLIDHN